MFPQTCATISTQGRHDHPDNAVYGPQSRIILALNGGQIDVL